MPFDEDDRSLIPSETLPAQPLGVIGSEARLFSDLIYDRFPARLTSLNIVSGQFRYGFIEQLWDKTSGVYSDFTNGMKGDGTNIFATEVHNIPVPEVTVPLSPTPAPGTGPLVWLRFKAVVNGEPEYEFNNGYPPTIALIESNVPDGNGLYTAVIQQYDPVAQVWNNITTVKVRDANM